MKTGSILDRADAIAKKAEKYDQEGTYQNLVAQPTEMHRRLVEVLLEILTLVQRGEGSENVPTPMRAMVRSVRHLQPMILEELAHVAESDIAAFIDELIVKLKHVTDGAN